MTIQPGSNIKVISHLH